MGSSEDQVTTATTSETTSSNDSAMMQLFEKTLWASRWVIVTGVLANIFGAILMVLVACYDFFHLLELMMDIAFGEAALAESRSMITLILIEIVDGFLMAGVLFIFGFGLYELFISKLTVAGNFEVQGKILNIQSIDHLKSKLGNLILMILVVKFFYYTVGLKIEGIQEIAFYAGSVALVAVALFLTQAKGKK